MFRFPSGMLSITKISDKHILKGVGFCKRITAVVLKGSWLFVVFILSSKKETKKVFRQLTQPSPAV